MMIKEITAKPIYQHLWQSQGLHALQSWDWASVKETEGWSILRLGIFPAENAEKEAIPETVISLQIKTLPVLKKKLAYAPKVTSLAWFDKKTAQELEKLLVAQDIAFVLYEFDKGVDTSKISADYQDYQGHIQPQQTNQVSLGKSEEVLFMCLDGKYRRNIKKSQREGVTISQYQFSSGGDNTKPIQLFYSVMQSIFANTKFMERDAKYFQTIWNTLGANDLARIFIAEKAYEDGHKDIVGAYLVINDNKGAYELYGGVTRAGRDVEAGYLLKWEAIKYFNNLGKEFYDHWGVAPKLANGEYDSSDELYQISKFKAGFGGDFVSFPEAKAQIFSKTTYQLFLLGQSASKLKLKLQKSLKG